MTQLRADAERNRQRILDAAGELFAQKGLAVGLDEIARHAGVGVGTAYRRFANKGELIDALFEERVDHLVALAERALEHDDPWQGLKNFLEAAVELHVANRALKEMVFAAGGPVAERMAAARGRIAPLVQELIGRAQASGDLRDDVAFTDMPLIQFMVSGVADIAGPAWRRYLGIVLDGLRTERPSELTHPPLSPDEFERALSG